MTPPAPRSPALKQASENPYRDWLLRGLVVILISASAWLLWWSINRYTLVQKRSRELNDAVTRLASEVDQMDSKFSKEEMAKIEAKYGEARNLLFVGQPPVDEWLAGIRQQLIPLAMDGKAELGKPSAPPPPNQKISVTPATISVDLQPAKGIEAASTPYQRLLRLTRLLSTQERRVDLVDLNVSGGSNSVARAVAVVELWGGEETKEAK